MGISPRYPPVTGRLHTRYAPVRRSPAAHCWTPLPLDLHVLSLPLAFILSQDQTLHCKNCLFVLPLTRLVSRIPGPAGASLGHTLSHLPILSMSFHFRKAAPLKDALPCRKRVQRYNHFPKHQNFFSLFFPANSVPAVLQRVGSQTFFHQSPPKASAAPAKQPGNSFFSAKFGVSG